MGEVHDLGLRIQDLGDGSVLGVIFSGQLQVLRGKLELALGFELGAQADHLAEGYGFFTGECRRLSRFRKWPLRLKTYENGLVSSDSRPFSIARDGAQQELARLFRCS